MADAASPMSSRRSESGDDTRPAGQSALLRWIDALRVAALVAVDPHGLGGVVLTGAHGPVRERWLSELRSLLPAGTPIRRVPSHIRDDRLLGGLDLAATLQAGRPVAQAGLMAQADGGLLLVPMAERLSQTTAARICAALDQGEVTLAREGLMVQQPARVGVVALDESLEGEESLPARLIERLAFRLDVRPIAPSTADADLPAQADDAGSEAIRQAREALGQVTVDEDLVQALCSAALALGVDSMRATLLALRTARAAAALDGRTRVEPDDAELAARLVLAPRATRLPEPPLGAQAEPATQTPSQAERSNEQAPGEPPPEPGADPGAAPTDPPPPALPPESKSPADRQETDPPPAPQTLQDQVLEAARASIPEGLLALLALGNAMAIRSRAGGRMGARRDSRLRGRPMGSRPGMPGEGGRLALVDTLRAAAPWQRLRRAEARSGRPAGLIQVRASDFRVARLQERAETTTIFAVDASGSSAMHRLAEAKGAVERLLADCYVRRDRVAVVAFRGRTAELLLPPTRSLARAKRSLAGLPGGGGTPLAAGIDAAFGLAEGIARRGGTPVLVLLTDGRANVARDGTGGRAQAEADARQSAQVLRIAGHASLLIDTSPQPQPLARQLADTMGAVYLPLPQADAGVLSRAVQAASVGVLRGSATGATGATGASRQG